MVRELNMDTQRQNFWKESIDKEATVRLAWHMQFSKEFANKSIPLRKKKVDSFLPKIGAAQLVTANSNNARKIKYKATLPANFSPTKAKGDEETTTLLIEMRPVTPLTKSMLYKGFSALGEGRYAYLQERKKKKPEQKYKFPITNGWEYGWKITDAMKNSTSKPAEFGRTRIVKDSFYRNNGVAPHDDELLSSCFQ